MIFPELQNKSFAKVNLDAEAEKWLAEQGAVADNPLLDPLVCEAFVGECHKRLGIDFSYGGYLEDRSHIWRGSYLDKDRKYVHLGIDFNVPQGTAVASVRPSTVIRIDDDYPEPHGWGNRVIVEDAESGIILIYAHLERPDKLRVGESLSAGQVFAQVGNRAINGGWFPHLHVQAVGPEHYRALLENDLRQLDGYGKGEDIEALRLNYPDPIAFTGIK